jgi:phosphate transport system substrate-binding protein
MRKPLQMLSLFGLIAFLVPAQAADYSLRLHGSNTIGAQLAPALVDAWLASKNASSIKRKQEADGLEKSILAEFENGDTLHVQIRAYGSSTGFKALIADQADIGMASRRAKASEAAALSARGDLLGPQGEHVIGLDGIAVVVQRDNPVTRLNKQQLAEIFAGEKNNWRDVGGLPNSIQVNARDENSGTWDTFQSLVLGKTPLVDSAKRYEANAEVSAAVAGEPNAIGFAGFAAINDARALEIAEEGARPTPPNTFSVATEDYPLARRLYMYLPPQPAKPLAREFVLFVKSNAGQRVVAESGFVAQAIDSFAPDDVSVYPEEMRQLIDGAQRLSLNLRFEAGRVALDNKALDDVRRIAEFAGRAENRGRKLLLFGFADAHEKLPIYSIGMSTDRADQVAKVLTDLGVRPFRVRGYGMESPVASNETDAGRMKNRRVEIWIQ